MQKVICSQCGTEIRIAGLAAICRQCGALVTAPTAPPPAAMPVEPLDEPVLDLLEDVPLAPLDPEPPPAFPPVFQGPQFEVDQPANTPTGVYWAIGLLAVAVFALLIVITVMVASKPPPAIVTAPVPTVVAPTPAPKPRGSEWFSEQPLAPAPPIVAPRPVEPPPEPAAVAATSLEPPALLPHAHLARLQPIPPSPDRRTLTDDQITNAIKRGTTFLLSQFAQTRLKGADAIDAETFAGLNALATYALLQCGKSMNDVRLAPQSDLVKGVLDRLKDYPMRGNRATYSRSLRISALTVFTRPEDRSTISEDLQWLLRSSMNGAFSYDLPPTGRTRDNGVWDNSNSQYGAPGAWAAAEAGFMVPWVFWQNVERHWMAAQSASGGWSYNAGQQPTLAMTAAGANMLFVARDQMAAGGSSFAAFPAISQSIARGLEWLDEGDNILRIAGHRGYTVYSIERAGLASGFKYFGKHDWYLEFARKLVDEQLPDGSWPGDDGIVAETAFDLLFLLRGRQPVLYSKLRFDGAWNNRPREVSAFTRFSSNQLERPHNWQVSDVRRDWWEWLDAPVMLITSDRAPILDDVVVDKLRAYSQNGGLIFLHAERDSAEFGQFAAALSRRLFPDYPFTPLSPDHPIYSSAIPLDQKPALLGVSNGARLLLVFSPTDITRLWQPRPGRTQRMQSDLGLNIGIYAAGRRDVRSRLDSPYVPEPTAPAIGRVPVARLRYGGNWDPEPAGWPRISRFVQGDVGIGVEIVPKVLTALTYETAPIAHLTGTDAVEFGEQDIRVLREFVTRGGVLLIDACGGANEFANSVQTRLLPRLAADVPMIPLPQDHPIQTGAIPGGLPLPRPQLRENLPADDAAPRFLKIGAGIVLYSPQDISCALVGVNTVGIRGYQPAWVQQFIRNVLLWTTRHVAEVPAP